MRISDEDQLLICCSRVSMPGEVVSCLEELLRRPLDWKTVLEKSHWHRIRPLTYLHLRGQPPGVVPEQVLSELAARAQELSRRNQRLNRALNEISCLFEEARLRLLAFKGPALTVEAYGSLELRECGDLDVLLHHDDLAAARAVLESNGFEYRQDSPAILPQPFACVFSRSPVDLDVHWDLAPRWLNYHIDFDRLWEGGAPLVAGNRFVRKMSPEASLCVLSIHGAKHWWERLRWICDIAELIRSGSVQDWERVEREAVSSVSRRTVALGLWLAANVLDAPIPVRVKRELDRFPAVEVLGTQVRRWLQKEGSSREFWNRFRFRMNLCERKRDRAVQLARYLWSRSLEVSP